MLHEKFVLIQNIDHTALDYSKMEHYRNVLKELDTLGNQFHWMFDYAKTCFFYLSETKGIFPKRETAHIPDNGYQCLIDNSHPDDVIYMLRIQKMALDFFFKQKIEDRLNFKFVYKMRVLTQGGDYVPFNFQIKAAAMDVKGNLWMSLAQGLPSQTDRLIKPLIISTTDENLSFSTEIKHSKLQYSMPKCTERELQMIKLLAKNKSIDEICIALQFTLSTFKFHRKNLLKKLNASNCYIAVENALLLGLLKD
jgi:DNA-binding CsgD family transcriptional regulator